MIRIVIGIGLGLLGSEALVNKKVISMVVSGLLSGAAF